MQKFHFSFGDETPFLLEKEKEFVLIDLAACYFAVDSIHPGCAEASKGGVVRPLKGNVSWV